MQLQVGGGTIWKLDWNFKPPKYIQQNFVRLFKALFGIMNEYNDPLTLDLTCGEKFEEVEPCILGLVHRCQLRGYDLPKTCYVDDWHNYAAKLLRVLPMVWHFKYVTCNEYIDHSIEDVGIYVTSLLLWE